MNEFAVAMQERTMRFAVRLTRFCRTLPETWEGRHVRDQLFRAGTGVASNYHATFVPARDVSSSRSLASSLRNPTRVYSG